MATGNEYNTLTDLLKGIADALRAKIGTTAQINAQDFPSNIAGIPKAAGNASTSDVLSGVTFSNKNGGEQTGAMPNNGTISKSISPGGSYTVPKGYHSGSGTVSANMPSGNAGTGDVLSGKTFSNSSTNGATGTMTNRGAWSTSISPGGSVTIPAGYHNGGGTVSAHNATASLGEVTKGVVNGRSDKNINATVGHYIATSVVRVNSGATRILWGDGVWGVNIYQITSTTVSLHNGDGNSGGYVIFKINIG